MRVWRAGVKAALVQIPRPLDDPHASATGQNSDRILLFGAGLSVGWGVSTHDLALPGFLARALTGLTGRGTDVDIVVHPDILLRGALNRLNAIPLWRYDAIVIVLGINEALQIAPLKAWQRDLSALVAALGETVAGIPVVIAGIQEIRSIPVYDSFLGGVADIHAAALNRASAQICAEAAHVIFVPLPSFASPSSGRHRSPDKYAESARAVAAAMLPALVIPRHQIGDPYRPLPHDEDRAEADRQAAVDAVDLSDPRLGQALDRLLDITQRSLQAKAAVFTVIDHDRQLPRASTWTSLAEVPRAGSFCDTTIRRLGGMVVLDALRDERFRNNPLVVGDPHIRFYAGFPIESLSGERIGTLCVFDTKPWQAEDMNLACLRDLALMLQRELRTSQ